MTQVSADDFSATIHELRGSLTELLGVTGADFKKPQHLSRVLGLDKSLARKVAKIVETSDAGEAIQNLPGEVGFNMLLSAVERAGASAEQVGRARQAILTMERVVERQFGDRPTLEIVVDALPSFTRDRLMLSRKLAFRGNSGIWGIQAKARVNTAIIAPNPGDPDLIDAVAIGGWIDVRRVRSDAQWAIFRRRRHGISDSGRPRALPLDPDEAPNGPLLLRDFCSSPLPPIDVIAEPNGDIVHELGPSPLGNDGVFTLFSGWVDRKIGTRWADDTSDRGEFGAIVSAPTETLIFDFLVHRGVEFATRTEVAVFGNVGNTQVSQRDLLPVTVRPYSLGRFPAVVDSPHVPRYGEVIQHAFNQVGWDRRDFIGMRYVLEYPPFPSTMRVSFPLENRPG